MDRRDRRFHPSVEEIKQAVQSKGGTLTCPVCGREEFAVEEVDIMSGHRAYGAPLLHRAQLVCANCGCIVTFDLTKLQPIGEGS
jgi:transcription elongation factor Elf1